MRLRIAQVAPVWSAIPPETYGGTELIVDLLIRELVGRGHDVTLFGTADSQTRATLHSTVPAGVIDIMKRGEAYQYEHYALENLSAALRCADSFDIIHCQLGSSFAPVAALTRTPVLFTLHTPLSIDDQWVLKRHPETALAAISRYQMAAIPPAVRTKRLIHHGCDLDAYEFSAKPGMYLAYVARMGPQKSPLDAIQIAKAAGMPIVLAGKPQNWEEEHFFANVVRPLIDGSNVIYAGPVNAVQKSALLRDAAALLFPIQGPEAFGLIMIEAMACGTPVIATNAYSAPEIVDCGITGYCGSSAEEMAALVPKALLLDRAAVRERACRRFSHLRMVDDYLDFYAALAGSGNGRDAAAR